MNDTDMIDSCQAHLPVQQALNIELTGVVIDSEPHLSYMCKTSLLFAPLAVSVHSGCSAFLFYSPTKLLIQLHINYKAVCFPRL